MEVSENLKTVLVKQLRLKLENIETLTTVVVTPNIKTWRSTQSTDLSSFVSEFIGEVRSDNHCALHIYQVGTILVEDTIQYVVRFELIEEPEFDCVKIKDVARETQLTILPEAKTLLTLHFGEEKTREFIANHGMDKFNNKLLEKIHAELFYIIKDEEQ